MTKDFLVSSNTDRSPSEGVIILPEEIIDRDFDMTILFHGHADSKLWMDWIHANHFKLWNDVVCAIDKLFDLENVLVNKKNMNPVFRFETIDGLAAFRLSFGV